MNLFRRNNQYLDKFVGVADKIQLYTDRYTLVFIRGHGFTSTGMRIRGTGEVVVGSIGLGLHIRTPHAWRDDI